MNMSGEQVSLRKDTIVA